MIFFNDLNYKNITTLLSRYGLTIRQIPLNCDIPGSFWGNPEAGLIDDHLYVRPDTPVHSLLHEACHYICMPAERRENLHTDAGGDYDEENAVCYLQILLADQIHGYSAAACMEDMDAWGYSFRLGSTRAWFEEDAEDARVWLGKYTSHIHLQGELMLQTDHKNPHLLDSRSVGTGS